MLDDILNQLNIWLEQALTLDFLLQVGIFALALLVAYFTRKLIRRQVEKVENRVRRMGLVAQQFPWTLDLLIALSAAVFPFVVWLLSMIGAGVLQAAGRPSEFLRWLSPLFALWAGYLLIGTIISLNLTAERARVWRYQVLRTLVLIIAFLHITGLLDDILSLRVSPSDGVLLTLRSVLLGTIVLIFFFWLSGIIRRLLGETMLPRAGVEPAVNQVISTFSGYAIAVLGILAALSIMGINIATITVIAGGIAVGVGFGLQEVINNFISGFILLTERSLAPGDVIEVDGNMGIVQAIGLRTMQITTPDDVEMIIPNGHLLGSTVTSYTHKAPEMRIHIMVGAVVEANPREVLATLVEAAKEHPKVMAEPEPVALVAEFEGDTIQYDLEFWIERPLLARYVSSDVRVRIWELFDERGIGMDPPEDVLLLNQPG